MYVCYNIERVKCCSKQFHFLLCFIGLEDDMAKNLQSALKAGKQYLKTDFRIHTARETPCADHCSVYALSSRTEPEYRGTCSHQHNISCDRCEALKNAVADIQLVSASSSDIQLRYKFVLDSFTIYNWSNRNQSNNVFLYIRTNR